ncbi:MAG: hypothetical protein NUV32_09395 [Exilispira sp.]|nr:hypothetical protein [Exilispira sp.]
MIIFYFSIIILIFGTFVSFLFKKNIKLIIFSGFLILTSLIFLVISSINFINKNFPTLNFLNLNRLISQTNTGNLDYFSVFSNLNFEITSIGLFFIFVLSVVSFCIALYMLYYIRSHHINQSQLNFHLFNFSLLLSSIVLLLLTSNLLIFLILWEIMGISSFFCIFFDGQKSKTINAAILYIVMMHISFLLILIGTIICYNHVGSFSFEKIQLYFQQANSLDLNTDLNKVKLLLFSIFTVGFIIKLGIFPFHFWLPEAHPASPSHISSFMSSIVIKTGIYGLFITLNLIGLPTLTFAKIIIFIGLISALIGIINAASQTQIKKFLAYSSVENAGILLFLFGSSIYGLINNSFFLYLSSLLAIFIYLLNHAFSKSSAFLSAGVIINETKNDDLNLLGGLVHYYKDLTGANLISSISLSALPPFGNFIGELLILIAYANYITNYGFSIIPFFVFLFIGLIGSITLLGFTKYFATGFLGKFRGKSDIKKRKLDVFLTFSLYIQLIFALIFSSSFFYNFYFKIIKDLSEKFSFLSGNFILEAEMLAINKIFNSFYKITILFLALFIVFWLLYSLIKLKREKTWSCGFISKSNDNFQYTANSFVEPYISVFKPLVGIKVKKKEKEMVFIEDSYIETEHQDIVQKNFINPIIEKINYFFEKLSFIQSGRTQDYILYGLIFLIIIIIITLIRYI